MKAKISVATVSRKAYYKLVNELKRKNMPFISLKPWDPIPFNIKVVITTKEERHLVAHPNVLRARARIVSEAGTNHFMNETVHRRGLRDAMAAIKIAGRKGQFFPRKILE